MAALLEIQTWTAHGSKIDYFQDTNSSGEKFQNSKTVTKDFVKKAESAKDKDINPDEVKTALANVVSVCNEQMTLIANEISSVSSDASQAVIVQGSTIGPVVTETASLINGVGSQAEGILETYYNEAVEGHNKQQQIYNDQAKVDAEAECRSAGYTVTSCTSS